VDDLRRIGTSGMSIAYPTARPANCRPGLCGDVEDGETGQRPLRRPAHSGTARLKEHILGRDDGRRFHRFVYGRGTGSAAAERSPQPRMTVGEPDQEPLRDERHRLSI